MKNGSKMPWFNKIALVYAAITYYEQIRYGNAYGLGFDAALDEVLKQMGLEK